MSAAACRGEAPSFEEWRRAAPRRRLHFHPIMAAWMMTRWRRGAAQAMLPKLCPWRISSLLTSRVWLEAGVCPRARGELTRFTWLEAQRLHSAAGCPHLCCMGAPGGRRKGHFCSRGKGTKGLSLGPPEKKPAETRPTAMVFSRLPGAGGNIIGQERQGCKRQWLVDGGGQTSPPVHGGGGSILPRPHND